MTVPPSVASVVSIAGIFSGHRDGLSLLAWLHHQVHANGLPNFQQHAAVLHIAEPFGLGANRIRAGVQAVATYCPAPSVVRAFA